MQNRFALTASYFLSIITGAILGAIIGGYAAMWLFDDFLAITGNTKWFKLILVSMSIFTSASHFAEHWKWYQSDFLGKLKDHRMNLFDIAPEFMENVDTGSQRFFGIAFTLASYANGWFSFFVSILFTSFVLSSIGEDQYAKGLGTLIALFFTMPALNGMIQTGIDHLFNIDRLDEELRMNIFSKLRAPTGGAPSGGGNASHSFGTAVMVVIAIFIVLIFAAMVFAADSGSVPTKLVTADLGSVVSYILLIISAVVFFVENVLSLQWLGLSRMYAVVLTSVVPIAWILIAKAPISKSPISVSNILGVSALFLVGFYLTIYFAYSISKRNVPRNMALIFSALSAFLFTTLCAKAFSSGNSSVSLSFFILFGFFGVYFTSEWILPFIYRKKV